VRVVAEPDGTFYGRGMVKGDIYTVAGNGAAGFSGNGGPATSAKLVLTGSVAFDSAGNMLIPGSTEVRAVAGSTGTFYHQAMTAGDIYTIAGNTNGGSSGNGGKAINAELMQPDGLAVSHWGPVRHRSLHRADPGNQPLTASGGGRTARRQAGMAPGRVAGQPRLCWALASTFTPAANSATRLLSQPSDVGACTTIQRPPAIW
jgi:hypothetical protein